MKTIPYSTQFLEQDDINAVVKALSSDWLTQGPRVEAFERQLCQYTGAKYAVAVSNGTAALHLACLAAGVGCGDEVLTSPLTFVASANCALYCGGTPVFIDTQDGTANIDVEKLESYLKSHKKSKTSPKVLIPVHFAGHSCAMKEIYRVAQQYGLTVIEDAAHALGGGYLNKKVGSCQYADMTTLSFHPLKSMTTAEGGAILTNNKKLYEKLLLLRSHGITKNNRAFISKSHERDAAWFYEMQALGFNYRISDIQCALGISQLKKMDRFIEARARIASQYIKAFTGNPYFDFLVEENGTASSWHLFVLSLKKRFQKNRRAIFDALRAKGLGVGVHYIPVYWQPFYQQMGFKKGLCPNAEDFYSGAISIPIYPKMTQTQVNKVISIVRHVSEQVLGR